MSITNRANAHVSICPFGNRLDSKRRGRGAALDKPASLSLRALKGLLSRPGVSDAVRLDAVKLSLTLAGHTEKPSEEAKSSVNDALSLTDLSNRASFVEDLLFYRLDDGLRIERPANDPVGQFDAEYDAYLLIRQLQRPTNHIGDLHRLTHRALAGRYGHLTPSDQKLMQRQSRLWPGALEISDESIVAAVVRFEMGKINDPGEVQRLTGIAYRIVKIAQEFVSRTEAARLAVTKGRPLSDLAEAGKRNWYGTWPLIEPPLADNAPWNEGSP